MKYLYKNLIYGRPQWIIKAKGVYIIGRTKKEEILQIYNECVEADWDKEKLQQIKEKYRKIKKPKNLKYITQIKSGKYVIYKNGKYYCTIPTKEEAIHYRNLLQENDWDISVLPPELKKRRKKHGLPKHIRKTKDGKYQIQKGRSGWGVFKTLEEAVEERDLLEKYNWSYDFVDLM